MQIHLKVAAAVAAATLAAGCSHAAPGTVSSAKAPAATLASKMTIKPVAGSEGKANIPAPGSGLLLGSKVDPAGLESLWNGSIGSRSASISANWSSVRANLGNADFSGSVFGSTVSGWLRRSGQAQTESVTLSIFGGGLNGWVGNQSADVQVSGNWVMGRVGNRRLNVTFSPSGINGDMDGRHVWMGGTGVQQGEGSALCAALLALTAVAD